MPNTLRVLTREFILLVTALHLVKDCHQQSYIFWYGLHEDKRCSPEPIFLKADGLACCCALKDAWWCWIVFVIYTALWN